MAKSFGSTGASSLIRAATAAYNKTQAFNDASAAYEFDLSPKTQDDINKYNTYLSKRIDQTKNSDPTKALSLTRTGTSAYRSFNSAEIGRATTAVKFGDISSRDKYAQLTRLQQAAMQNGDDNLAQSLYSQMASLSVQIQNEDTAAAARGTAEQAKALSAYKKGYAQQAAKLQDGIKQLNAAKLAGQITPADYNDRMSQIYLGNEKGAGLIALTQEAAKVTGDEDLTYQNKLDQFAADRQVQKYVNGTSAAAGANGNLFGQVITKDSNGLYSFKDRPNSEITGQTPVMKDGKPVMDANGHATTIPTFTPAQAFEGKDGSINGFQYATNIDSKTGLPAPGTGAGALRQIDGSEINHDDPSGVPYFINEAGQKKFIGKDPKTGRAIMGNTPDVVTGNFDNSKQGGLTNPLDFYKNLPAEVGKVSNDFSAALSKSPAKGFLAKLPLLGNLIRKNDAAQEQIRQAAIIKKQQEAYQISVAQEKARLASQPQMLPVFAPKPPAPTPTNQYQLPPLPTPVPLPGSKVTTPARTGNYKQDVLNLGRSLGNLL